MLSADARTRPKAHPFRPNLWKGRRVPVPMYCLGAQYPKGGSPQEKVGKKRQHREVHRKRSIRKSEQERLMR